MPQLLVANFIQKKDARYKFLEHAVGV